MSSRLPGFSVLCLDPDPVDTSHDMTEGARRVAVDEINSKELERAAAEAEHGQVWDTAELQRDFEVEGFAAPYVVVHRKSDGVRGTLTFQHSPRFFWGFEPEGK